MDEIYRISKTGGEIIISVPYFRSAYAFIHPNIKSFFTVNTFNYFDPQNELYKKYKYTKSTFKIEKLKMASTAGVMGNCRQCDQMIE